MFSEKTYADRRRRVLEKLGNSVLVLPAAPARRRNGDAEYPFRQESDLLYLTGFGEPESVLVLAPQLSKPFTLFVRPRDREMEIWNGRRAGLEGAVRDFGADQAFLIDDFENELPKLLAGAQGVFAPIGLDGAFDAMLLKTVATLRARQRTGTPVPERVQDLGGLVHELRLYKDADEIAVLRTAAELTRRGFERALAETKPGLHEYEIEAELLYAYRKGGGDGPGYEPIVASGVNATILHYRTGRDVLKEGELLLIDSGCEFAGYTADVTRTWPIGGRFSAPQAALYDVVLAAHEAAIASVRPGTSRDAVHEVACRTLIAGLLELKLLEGTVESCWKDKSFRRFYMHGTSHWLGLDVHDAGLYYAGGAPKPLAPGMVLTVEPGLYVSVDDEKAPAEYRGIGIRIEDDVLVTADGHEVLTAAIPRSRAAMERGSR
jgi:Xaa-Pro aminopeptidase